MALRGLFACFVIATAAAGGQDPWWPQFHGPRRDNISPDRGLPREWPPDGPKLLWKFSQCGRGFSTVAIADGKLFLTGDFGRDEYILALDLHGKLLWKTRNGQSWRGPTPGARTTPTYDDGILYHLNPTGRLAALDADTGKELWSLDLKEKFGARFGIWAMAENLAIDGQKLFCVPGGPKGRIVALDKKTGRLLWANTEIQDTAAYCSPTIATHNGTKQLITLMAKHVVSVAVEDGRLLWTYPHRTLADQNVTSPLYHAGMVFVTSGHASGGRLLALAPDSRSVRQLWFNRELDNCHGGVILLGGHLYGSGCRLYKKGLVVVNLLTGRTTSTNPRIGKVSITYADGMLYCLDQKGRVMLVEPRPGGCRIVSQFRVPLESKDLPLAHPVVCGGRLYIRHAQNLFAYSLRPEG